MNLYETAINGLGIGTKADEINKAIKDLREAGNELGAALMLEIAIKLDDLQRAERQAAHEAKNLRSAVTNFDVNPSVSNAGWLTHHANKAEGYAKDAQAAYTAVGQAWNLWKLASKTF